MSETSRVQNMLNEQNSEIIFLKSQVMRQNLDIVGYKVRNTQLEAALREIVKINPFTTPEGSAEMMELVDCILAANSIAQKALEWGNDRAS